MRPLLLAALAALGCGSSAELTADARPGTVDAPIADARQPDARVDDARTAPDAVVPDAGPAMVPVTGAITPVHDPAIIQTEAGYFLYATGSGIPVRRSTDLVNWTLADEVFATKPEWITTTDARDPNALWAPDVSFFGGKYHLYYSASSFGSNESCIGHATTANPGSEAWVDQGSAVICSTKEDNWNAIDPNAAIDADGNVWLAFGSFWGGLKLIRIDPATGQRSGVEFTSLATRANTAVEASFIVRRGGYHYLFESVDFCCRGVESTYKIMVGRASDVRGPYLDRSGAALLSGGGTLVLQSSARWKGPGHNAYLRRESGEEYLVYHSYDADVGGIPTLRIAELRWSADGWPITAGP